MKIVELILDEDQDASGIEAISIVENPAIEEDFIALKSINNIEVKTLSKIKFKIISTGSEFDKNHFIHPTNAEYIEHFIKQNGHIVSHNVHLKDNQNQILKEIKKSNSDITIVIGGTGKSIDDINFDKFNLKLNGLDLKPGRPFKYFYEKSKMVLFFPGNPSSSFVLTNILLKSMINYYLDQSNLEVLVQEVIATLREHGGLAVRDLDGREENITFSLPKGLRIPTVAVED